MTDIEEAEETTEPEKKRRVGVWDTGVIHAALAFLVFYPSCLLLSPLFGFLLESLRERWGWNMNLGAHGGGMALIAGSGCLGAGVCAFLGARKAYRLLLDKNTKPGYFALAILPFPVFFLFLAGFILMALAVIGELVSSF